jgi:hypothetical protein
MIDRDELEAWARLYDLGHQSLEENEETRAARADLDRVLGEAWKREVQAGSISFREFRRQAIRQMLAFLAKERRPPAT